MPYDYPDKSLKIQARLSSLGLLPDRLMKIGAFLVAYGLFETTHERALWTIAERSVAGERPFTEKMKTEEQFKTLAAGNKLSEKCNGILRIGAAAAADLRRR